MTELTDEDYVKVRDLRRIYGRNGLASLFDIDPELIERALSKQEIAKPVSSGVKRYWKRWMENCRPLDKPNQDG